MTTRGKKSKVVIADHTLTFAELNVLDQLKKYMLRHPTEAVPLMEIFIDSSAKRHCVRRLASLGVLKACQLDLTEFDVKWVTP